MQQPRQQRTYADLYSQRPASPSPVSRARDNLAANGSNGQACPDPAAAATAATKAKCKSPAPQNTDEALQHNSDLTPAQQPSKIPACPGSPGPDLPSTGGASSKAANHAAAVHTRIPSPTPAAATHRNGTGAQCSGSKEQLQAAVTPYKVCYSGSHGQGHVCWHLLQQCAVMHVQAKVNTLCQQSGRALCSMVQFPQSAHAGDFSQAQPALQHTSPQLLPIRWDPSGVHMTNSAAMKPDDGLLL